MRRYDDVLLLLSGELAVDRNRQTLCGGSLGVRKLARTIAQVREARLQVKRHGIVDLVADAGRIEVPLQRVAFGRADDELIEDVLPVGRLLRQPDDFVEPCRRKQLR